MKHTMKLALALLLAVLLAMPTFVLAENDGIAPEAADVAEAIEVMEAEADVLAEADADEEPVDVTEAELLEEEVLDEAGDAPFDEGAVSGDVQVEADVAGTEELTVDLSEATGGLSEATAEDAVIPEDDFPADGEAIDEGEDIAIDEDTNAAPEDGEQGKPEGGEQNAPGDGKAYVPENGKQGTPEDAAPAEGKQDAPSDGEAPADADPAGGKQDAPVDGEAPADGTPVEGKQDAPGDSVAAAPEVKADDESPESAETPAAKADGESAEIPESEADGESGESAEPPEAEADGEAAEAPETPETAESPAFASVRFEGTPEAAAIAVWPAAADGDASPIPAEPDGGYLLPPGDYTYSAEAEGCVPARGVPFTVPEGGEALTVAYALEEAPGVAEAQDAAEAPEVAEADTVTLEWTDHEGTAYQQACAVVTMGTTTLDGGYYAVTGNVTASYIEVNGTAWLVLADGASLTAYCIDLEDGATLNVAVSGEAGSGKLTAVFSGSGTLVIEGGDITANSSESIGIDCQDLAVYGGKLTATGRVIGIQAAGNVTIGGKAEMVTASGGNNGILAENGSVVIQSGTVNATGSLFAGIDADGSVTIGGNAEKVTATGGYKGISSDKGSVNIQAGEVEATGPALAGISASVSVTIGEQAKRSPPRARVTASGPMAASTSRAARSWPRPQAQAGTVMASAPTPAA